MNKSVYTSYNPFFILPFIVWLIAGGFFLASYNKEALFMYVNSRYGEYSDVAMSYLTNLGEGVIIISTLLLLPLLIKKLRSPKYFGAALTANIGAFLLSQGLKSYFNHPRPLTYFQKGQLVHIAESWGHYYHRSFPSGHTTSAFALFCFLSLFLPPRYRAWGLLFFSLALVVAYSRIYLAAHFFLDVYVGSIIGTFFSIFAVSIFYTNTYRPMIKSS